jgi:AcrR family transcriptional regulator
MSKQPLVKRRNAETTRAAILASARGAFARAGYDGAGVREIAAGAGVTAMMVNRYFGSKEKLFAEVLIEVMASPFILTPETLASPEMAKEMAKALIAITQHGIPPLEGFAIMIHSAASPRAAELSRKNIEQGRQKILSKAFKGPHAKERAAIALALVAGFQVMRQTIGLRPLVEGSPAILQYILEALFQELIDPR